MSFFKPRMTQLLSAVTVTGSSESKQPVGTKKTFQSSGFTTAGAGAATIIIEATNDLNIPYVQLGTISLTLSTTPVAEGFQSDSAWKYVRARLSAISGTNAQVSVNMTATNAS